jgi:hypothetical protein
LHEQLTAEEQMLSRLVIARETVEEILGEAAVSVQRVPAGEVEAAGSAEGGDEQAGVLGAGGSPIGVLTVPPWRPGMGGAALPRAYRDVLEVLADAGRPLRAGHLAAALGLGERSGAVEGLRSKLKRLVARGWLSEEVPGMFAVAERVIGQMGRRGPPGSIG